MSLPDDVGVDPSKGSDKMKRTGDRPPLRTREEVHVCGNGDCDSGHEDGHPHFLPESFGSTSTESSCHSHKLDYVSSSSPAESETFASLRRATVRTLSGEQLPRGQTSGPLWFGDAATGYTIAYVFRLADTHARGRQRYYALLALAGSDAQRAFSACPVIWNLFEQIANYIVQQAEDIVSVSTNDSPPARGQITPITSFLTGRPLEPDGYPRRGVANVRANGIAELVGNENFFCELHMMFVGILSELGKLLGGMRVRSPDQETQEESNEETKSISQMHGLETEGKPEVGDSDDMPDNPTSVEIRSSEDTQSKITRYPSPLCSGPGGMVAHRHQVAV